jgi:hypothetical protein
MPGRRRDRHFQGRNEFAPFCSEFQAESQVQPLVSSAPLTGSFIEFCGLRSSKPLKTIEVMDPSAALLPKNPIKTTILLEIVKSIRNSLLHGTFINKINTL